MIELRGVRYAYPDSPRPALDNVNLALPAGSFTLAVGASGSGKSTLLRTLNGLVPHFYGGSFAGTVRAAGIDPITLTPRRVGRHVGFVFQDPEAQFVVSTVEDEIAFGLENFGIAPAEMRRRVRDILPRMGLERLRTRRVDTLSGGERQRVAIASVLALQPAVLVLDEPTSQLDPDGAAAVLSLVDDLHKSLGLTVVLAEHRVERIVGTADLVLTVESGQAAVGAPGAMLAGHPLAPPVTRLGAALGWSPPPLTLAEARTVVRRNDFGRFAPQEAAEVAPTNHAPARSNDFSRSPGDAILDIRGVSFDYATGGALHDVDLAVRAGEVVALMGHNGAGKTTLLKLAIGLLRARSGEVRVLGRLVRGGETADLAQRVGYVPQNPGALLFADTVRDEVAFTRRTHGLPMDDSILDALGLRPLANSYPRDLSVGERQRAALAAVLAADPGLLLLDEPTRGLDSGQKTALASLLREQAATGRGVLLTTHDVELAAACADRVVILEGGRAAEAGDTAAVMARAPAFASQIVQLFPGRGWLTPEHVLAQQEDIWQ
ncbi:MAG: energy-coupling factor transporter ATPase [Anaerolineae bacterium]